MLTVSDEDECEEAYGNSDNTLNDEYPSPSGSIHAISNRNERQAVGDLH
jgi:hypothetical protein